jgi:TIR domain
MSGRIFINYRRGDDPGNTGRLFDRLEEAFSPDQLFMDVDNIPPGRDFVRVLEEQVAQCDVLLAIIGKSWLDARDHEGARRLDKPDDFVRIEIASALKQDKLVIPVLVQDARMPRPDELPDEIRPLARRNAVRLTHEKFKADAQSLIKAIQQSLDEASVVRSAKDEVRQEEVQARLSALAGLSAEQIAQAEELANWDLIKANANPSAQDFRNHIAQFPGGVTERFARARLEDLVWAGFGAAPTLDQLADFLAEFPQGVHAKEAAENRKRTRYLCARASSNLSRSRRTVARCYPAATTKPSSFGRWRVVRSCAPSRGIRMWSIRLRSRLMAALRAPAAATTRSGFGMWRRVRNCARSQGTGTMLNRSRSHPMAAPSYPAVPL